MKQRLIFPQFFLLLAGWASAASIRVGVFSVPSSQKSLVVPVTASSEQAFASFQFTVQYKAEVLQIVRVENKLPSFTVMSNINTPGVVRVAGFDPTLTGTTLAGTLAELYFTVAGSGTSTLILQNVKLVDSTGKTIPCEVSSGSVSVAGTQPGSAPSETPAGTQPSSPAVSSGSPVSAYTRVVPQPASGPAPEPEEVAQPQVSDNPPVTVSGGQTPSFPEKPPLSQPAPAAVAPSNSVVLLVKSEYGNPSPASGVTTFAKGDKVECRVEESVALSDKEKLVCAGYEGAGSVTSGSGNCVSFTIEQDSRITWKWKKETIRAPVEVKLGKPVLNKKKKTLEVPVLFDPRADGIATFQFLMPVPRAGYDLKEIVPGSAGRKLFQEVTRTREVIRVSGAFYPAFSGQNFLKLVFSGRKLSTKDFAFRLTEVKLWDEQGKEIPVRLP